MSTIEELIEITPFLSVLVALVAVLLGPLLSSWVARRQIVAPIRQKWIDELRCLLVDFLSTSQMLVVTNEANGLLNEQDIDKETYKKLLSIERKLTLMLNPAEDIHNQLMVHVRNLLDEVEHGSPDLLKFGSIIQRITNIAQAILKKEWTRVKKGHL